MGRERSETRTVVVGYMIVRGVHGRRLVHNAVSAGSITKLMFRLSILGLKYH